MPSGGSHPRYTDRVRDLIQDSIAAGARTYDIAKCLNVSDSIVSRLRGFYETFSTVSPAHPGVQGRLRKIHQEVEEGVVDFLEEYPTARQDKVSDFLADEFNIYTSQPSVSRLFRKFKAYLKTGRTLVQ